MKRIKLGLFLSLFVAQSAAADMRHYTAEYRLYIGGILLSIVDLQLSLSPDTYRLSAHIGPAGIGHVLSDSHVITTTKGALVNGAFQPERLDLSWSNDTEVKSTYMVYDKGVPQRFHSGYKLPPEALPKNQVDIKTVGAGSVDPFLAMLAPLRGDDLNRACDGELRVFDGRRLATLTAAAPTPIAANAHEFVVPIPLVACSVVWQPIGGYSERSMERATDLPPIEAHYGRLADTGFAAPLDMRAETKYGNISLYAKRYFEPIAELPAPFLMEDYLDETYDEE